MYTSGAISSLLLAAASLPSAMAASCYAIGYWNENSMGWGGGGTTYAGSQGIRLYNAAGTVIGRYTPCETCSPVCSDFIAIPTRNLSQVFEWGSTCGSSGFDECHGAYGSQTHIVGESPQSGTDFYGLGIDATSECRVNFQC